MYSCMRKIVYRNTICKCMLNPYQRMVARRVELFHKYNIPYVLHIEDIDTIDTLYDASITQVPVVEDLKIIIEKDPEINELIDVIVNKDTKHE